MKKFLIKWFFALPLAAIGLVAIGYGLKHSNVLSIVLGVISLLAANKLEKGILGIKVTRNSQAVMEENKLIPITDF